MSEEEQIILPERFKKIDYLISGGGQYIDTKYVPTNKTGYSIIFKTYQTDKTWRPVFGLYEPNITDNRIYFYTNPYPCVGWGTYNQLSSTSPWQNGEITCKFNYLNSRKVDLTCEGNSLSYDLTPLNFTPTVPLYLFSANGAQNIDINSMVGRISSFIITEGDEVVRHFVPCLDGDNVPCMYEIYTGEIHKNLGNGQFYYPNYYPSSNYNLPAGFKKCVYLQSDGTQWIDTGVIPDNETGLYYKALQLSYGNFVMFGVSENDEEIYPPIVFVKDIYYRWGKTRPKMMSWDKAGDLIFHSSLNLYNSKIAHFNSEDTDVERHVTSQTGTYTIPIWLFSYNCNGAYHETYGKWGGRIYRAQITQGVVLIRDFVPCLDANGRPCMYDLIEEEVFYNQSGGAEFTYCVEHELPSDFIKLKYLESETTQFIKTGYVPTNNTGIYIDCYNTFKTTSYTLPISMRETLGDTYITVGRVLKQGNPGFGWGAFTTLSGSGDCRYEATLNWLNDKKSTITAPAFLQRINTLSDLAFTPTKDLCMFGNHDYDGKYYTSSYRIYRAKISEGSEIVRDFVPAFDELKQKPCMYDLINNVAYYNDGEGEFLTNRDFEGTYKGYTGLGCIGNRLGASEFEVEEDLTK